MDQVLEVKNLEFAYEKKLIFSNISFCLERGDFMGILGSNGTGKSTLLKLFIKILTPLKGEIKLLGESLEQLKNWPKIGYLSQKATCFNSSFPANVEEVVGAHLFSQIGLFRKSKQHHREKIDWALEMVGLQDYRYSLIGNLSGGQQQRVFLARSIVNQPEILFLDEPTLGIDAQSQDSIYRLLHSLNEKFGTTIVIVTHDLKRIVCYANKLGILKNQSFSFHNNCRKEVVNNVRDFSI